MALIVQKYGGTSVGNIERIHRVAQRVAEARRAGNDLVVVLSAMSGETDRLLRLAHEITATQHGHAVALAPMIERLAAGLDIDLRAIRTSANWTCSCRPASG